MFGYSIGGGGTQGPSLGRGKGIGRWGEDAKPPAEGAGAGAGGVREGLFLPTNDSALNESIKLCALSFLLVMAVVCPSTETAEYLFQGRRPRDDGCPSTLRTKGKTKEKKNHRCSDIG